MTDLLGELTDLFGYVNPGTATTRSVADTDEMTRIRDAPRRVWQDDPELPRLVELLNRKYLYNRTPCTDPSRCEGCKALKGFKPAQAQTLRELAEGHSGIMGVLRVGAGKTLVSFIAQDVIKASPALLIIPAGQEPKTKAAWIQYGRHYRLGVYDLKTYEWLAHPKHADYLNQLKPKLIVADEAWLLQNAGSKVAKRISRYLTAKPDCVFVALSGTAGGRSIKEYWHYCRWALRGQAPVPHDPFEANAWAYALDEKVPPEARFEPGALIRLSPGPYEGSPISQARQAYADRFTSTRGVISTLEDIPGMGLRLSVKKLGIPQHVKDMIIATRNTWRTPHGEDFKYALEMWTHCKNLGLGVHYYWDPPAPAEWKARRREYFKFAREKLAHARNFDSEVHLKQKIYTGEIDDGGLLAAWEEIEPTFKPNPVPEWIDDTVLNYCAEWMEKERGVCWVSNTAFADKLTKLSGVPLFRTGGLDAQGRLIDDYRDGPAICSIASCSIGHNMQDYYYKNLVPSFPSTGKAAEQMMGRTHRDGQPAPEVTFEVLVTCRESYTSLAQAIRDAYFDEQTHRQPRKLSYAGKDLSEVDDLLHCDTNDELWKDIGY